MTKETTMGTPTGTTAPKAKTRSHSRGGVWAEMARSLTTAPAIVGIVIIAFFVVLSVAADVLAPYSTTEPSCAVFAPPSPEHWLGCDDGGIDVLSLYAENALIVRSAMLETLGADYVLTARAKGLPRRRIISAYAFRNAALPTITQIALSLGAIVSGSILVEVIFSWPGIGSYITNALQNADMSAVLGGTLIIGSVFIALNLLSDVLYRALDPRTRVR